MPESHSPSDYPLSDVDKLGESHRLECFDCGIVSLNEWLRRFALINQRSDSAQTYVVHRGFSVVGYYALTPGSVRKDEAPSRVGKGMPNHPIGVILLARIAVDNREQGKGLGKALLKDALIRIEAAADIVSARAVIVHAINESARRFYEHFGFEPSPLNDLQLFLLMKDLRKNLREARR